MIRKSSKTAIVFRILLAVYLAAVLYLCFGHFEHLPKISKTFLGFETDKVVHFLMFLPFPLLAFLAFCKGRTQKPWHSLLMTVALFAIGAIMAVATEIGQSYTAYRSSDPFDLRADLIALAISSIVVLIIDLSKQFRKQLS